MSEFDHVTMTSLLLLLLGFALSTGILLAFMVVRWLRQRTLEDNPPVASIEFSKFAPPKSFRPTLYHPPERWLAIRNSNVNTIQSALGLHNPTPCSWEEGLAGAREHKLFISPPVGGWVLVLGHDLPDPSDDVDDCFRFLADLSRKLGHLQYFNVNRVLCHHAWVRADKGHILRAYAWAGGTLWNQGRKTVAEMDLGLNCLDYGDTCERSVYGTSDPMAINVERIAALASRWSIDPGGIDERILSHERGIAGDASPHFR